MFVGRGRIPVQGILTFYEDMTGRVTAEPIRTDFDHRDRQSTHRATRMHP